MNDYLLKEYQIKRKMEDFALAAGYLPYEPALFENYENFSSLVCEVQRDQVVTVLTGQKFQLLRPDITTTIMNNIRSNVANGEVLKLFYQSTVYRSVGDGIKAINQFGIECLGITDDGCDVDILHLAISYLQNVSFILEVGTTKFLDKLLQQCNLNPQQEKVFRKLVYIKNREELVKFGKLHHLADEVQAILPHLFELRGTYEEVLANLQKFPIGDLLVDTLVDVAYLKAFDQQIFIDLSMTSKLSYYDGLIFKGYYRALPEAVLSGGRYTIDEIINGNAIGFSIDVDNWLKIQKKEGSTWHI